MTEKLIVDDSKGGQFDVESSTNLRPKWFKPVKRFIAIMSILRCLAFGIMFLLDLYCIGPGFFITCNTPVFSAQVARSLSILTVWVFYHLRVPIRGAFEEKRVLLFNHGIFLFVQISLFISLHSIAAQSDSMLHIIWWKYFGLHVAEACLTYQLWDKLTLTFLLDSWEKMHSSLKVSTVKSSTQEF